MRRHIGRRINAQFADGSTLSGTLSRVTRREVELTGAAFVQGTTRAPVDGTVVIDRAALLWTQVV
ncbi:hypothetical protein KIK06_23435 [Nocardiopsis sp. EMB25]|uniref:hypothetical protein n=1 Tax=Nocardiopsis sp. EMB25 TaxID=2835867 RepID=UPI002283485E|nr:hypothetical protein [Nocardiopsis sp. EMB25]MCY9786840.1 hypothetical protein [Nocardiopsis sp. EMB25]